jgi:UDPglucose 6-dehydrogenase
LRAAMIGLGKLGLPCAEVMHGHHDVVGYDLRPVIGDLPVAGSLAEAVRDRDLIFIAVATPHDAAYGGDRPASQLPPKDFDYSHVQAVLDDLDRLLEVGQLVVLISTTLPGTVRRELAPRLHRARLVYNPYLIAMGTVKHDMQNPEMVIVGAEHADGVQTLRQFYAPVLQNDPPWMTGTWDEAEAIKIFYNTFLSAKLALVNMIQDVAERNAHINVDKVTNALTHSRRILGPSYMTAGLGDGGPCHVRDNIALRHLAERYALGYDLFGAILAAREAQTRNLAEVTLQHGSCVVILGKSYKPGVPHTDGSCSVLLGHYIEAAGGQVHYYDPVTGDFDHPDDTSVYVIGQWADWLNVFLPHAGTTLIDPWRRYPQHGGLRVIHYGKPDTVRL